MFRPLTYFAAVVMAGPLVAQGTVHPGTQLTVDAGTSLRFNGNQVLDIASGANVVNDGSIVFGPAAGLTEAAGSPITGLGVERTTRSFPAPLSNADPAGLGLELTTAVAPGNVTVTRGHAPFIDNGGQPSVARWYDVDADLNAGLAAVLGFHYDLTELNGLNEVDLTLHTEGSGNYWWYSPSTVDVVARSVEASGLDSLGTFTLFDGISTSVPTPPNAPAMRTWLENDGDVLVVELPGASSPGDALLFDATGRIVSVTRMAGTRQRIDLSRLAPGTYRATAAGLTAGFVKP